jgi:triphosphoribosyl-dephospho-CoA synthase
MSPPRSWKRSDTLNGNIMTPPPGKQAPQSTPASACGWGPGRLAQAACLLEVAARKPGNVHRRADLPDLHIVDFLLSAAAIAEPLDRAATVGVGRAVLDAIVATRQVVSTNTNLGIVLLLAPLAAVPRGVDISEGVETILAATTVDDARLVFRAIRLAQPGGLGEVADHDVSREPTLSLRTIMSMAVERDLIARQYANGFREVFGNALPALRESLLAELPLETAIVSCYLRVLAQHPDSLIARKHGRAVAQDVSRRAAELVDARWPASEQARAQFEAFDSWLRHPARRFNPGTTADLVTAALFAALSDGTIDMPLARSFTGFSH